MKKVKNSRKRLASNQAAEWVTFIRISEANVLDKPLVLDPNWCAARGVNPAAEIVLQLLRDVVSPVIRCLQNHWNLSLFHFLIHDRSSGVPTTEDDRSAYIHLRLLFQWPLDLREVNCLFRAPFEMTRKVEEKQKEIGGVDLTLIRGRDIEWAQDFIGRQSELVLDFVDHHDWQKQDAGAMVRQTLQFWHYFVNMLQMNFR